MSDYQGNIIIKNPATPTGPAENGSAPGVWKLSEALGFIRQGIWPTQGVQGSDPYFSYTTLLLSTTSLGNANNNLFVDSSGAFNPISRNGNTTQGSVTPYSANWSNYFDGTGDNLKTPSNAAFAYGTGDFTWEMWVFPTSSTWTGGSSNFYLLDHGSNGGVIQYYANVIRYYNPTTGFGTLYNDGGSIPANTWTHIAITRQSGTTRLFVNGVLKASQSDANNYGNNVVTIADYGGGGLGFPGYVSNVRIVKGTAVYTSAFTPPTSALTAISGTSLLTCQSNRFRDASTNNFTITAAGNTLVTDFAPFSPSAAITYNQSDITNWSGYFDGSGDYLSIPSNAAFSYGTGDFTMEAWVYKAGSGAMAVVDSYTIGAGGTFGFLVNDTQVVGYQTNVVAYTFTHTVPTNSWNHIAFVRTGGNLICYVNGTSIGSQANSANFVSTQPIIIGRNAGSGLDQWLGYISNLRVVKGTAVYTGNFTPSTTNLTAISGTSLLTLQNAAFTDNSTNNFIITPFGNTTATGNSPFNTTGFWSNYFDGSSTITFNSISLAGDFTIEGWVYFIGTNNPTVLGANPPNNQSLRRLATGKHYFYRQGVDITGTIDVPLNQWVHLAATRSGGTVRIFTNGVLDGSNTITGTFSLFCLGGVDTGTDRLTGYTSNMRVVDGTALYTATFTPPTAPLTAVSGTALLTSQNGSFKDNSTNNLTLTRNGSPRVQSFDPFYTSTIASNGGSMYFDGTGDYVGTLSSADFGFGTSDYTIECWMYPTSTKANMRLWQFSGDSDNVDISNAGTTGAISYYNGSTSTVSSGGVVGFNAWNHVACVRSSGTVRVYLNGVLQVTQASTPNTTARILYIGGQASDLFQGYISNFRVVKGTAIYTSAFTPPTSPANPTPATTLLVNGMNAGIYDATAINDMETVGNAQVRFPSPFAPANYWAGAFDGSGDYLESASNSAFSILSGGDFTVEAWVYFNSISDNGGYGAAVMGRTAGAGDGWIFRCKPTAIEFVYPGLSANSTSFTFAAGQWYHIVAQRNGSTLYYYVNGTRYTPTYSDRTTDASAQAMFIGRSGNDSGGTYAYVNGYISNARIVKGTAVYSGTTITVPTTPLAAVSGTSLLTCQNKTFIDNSTNAFTITANGNATAGAIGPFTATGGTSMYFDGTGDYLTSNAANDLYAFGTGNFTIEMWFNLSSLANLQVLYDSRPNATDGLYPCIFVPAGGASVNLQVSGATQITGTAALSAGVWYHLALSRSSGSTRMFLNGTQIGSTYADTNAYLNSGTTRPFIGGSSYSAGTLTVNGYIDEVRVTKGYARYTANFTPPTQPFPTF